MTLPTIEIVKIIASDAYVADRSVINEALDIIASTPGFISQWHGLEIQEPQYFYLVIAWESLAHHQALMNDAEKYPRLGKALGKASQGIVWMYHANFDADVTKALGAPVTEFALWTLPETTDREAFAPGVKKLLSVLGEHIGEEIFDGGSGPIVEDKKLYLVCLGWHDAERFRAAVASVKEAVPVIVSLKGQAALDLKLAKLTKY